MKAPKIEAKNLVLALFLIVYSLCATAQFSVPEPIAAGTMWAESAHPVDFDLDGDKDVLVASNLAEEICWFENLGFGDFGPRKVISDNATNATTALPADLDSDGDPDVISCSRTDNKIAWYMNLGNGSFGPQIVISISQDDLVDLTPADLDEDGDIDIAAVSHDDSTLAWYENTGGGYFSYQISISTELDLPDALFTADLDSDNDYDILVATIGDDSVTWFENLGNGLFGQASLISSNVDGAKFVYASDLDSDCDPDVLASSGNDNEVVWFENLGMAQFGPKIIISTEVQLPKSLFSSDLDNDGDMDVLSASSGDEKIAWYPNLGDGVFGSQIVVSDQARNAQDVYADDIDGDGDLDILSASYGDDKIAWYSNLGSGVFSSENLLSKNVRTVRCVKSSDIDGDGDLDVVAASSEENSVSWFQNLGDDIFSVPKVISASALGANFIHMDDLNADGDQDILISSNGDDKVALYENMGDGNFGPEIIISLGYSDPCCAYSEDINSDGYTDILVAFTGENSVVWFQNLGNGQYGSQNIISTDLFGIRDFTSKDLDNDGDFDVISASYDDNSIAWFQNLGEGIFGNKIVISDEVISASTIIVEDIDLDGDFDILSSSFDIGFGAILYFENLGANNFGEPVDISEDLSAVRSIYCEDLNGDGLKDVLAGNADISNVCWYPNLGNGIFGNQNDILTAFAESNWVHAADFDIDGDMDILAGVKSKNWIGWFENTNGDGCTDPEACNYDSSAFVDSGECCIGTCGCTDPQAINYLSNAMCLDSSCVYRLEGCVFYDENENGYLDGDEIKLSNQQVVLLPLGWIAYTNEEGQFSFYGPGLGEYQIQVVPSESFPYVTTPDPLAFDIIFNYPMLDLRIGVSSEIPSYEIDVNVYSQGVGYPCDEWIIHNISYQNEGNQILSGIVEIEFSQLFQGFEEVTPIDSVNGEFIYMSFSNLLPGQSLFYNINFHTPTVNFIGQEINTVVRVFGFHQNVQVAFGEDELNLTMTCAYDPNDLNVFPIGYAEPHYILNETELEYVVRFQNTGNAPATDVLITDTIPENLDLSTFTLLTNSHSVNVTIRPEIRVIEFLFINIFLPDSSSDEWGSHGMVSFAIGPYPNLLHGTEINNTANIYFDNNPPIITNTTWNTIFICTDELASISGLELFACGNEEVHLFNDQPFLENHIWSTENDQIIGGDSILFYNFLSTGQVLVNLEVSNPICIANQSILLDLLPFPDLIISGDSTICEGEILSITAISDDDIQWIGFDEGVVLVDSPSENTLYEVLATNTFNCATQESILVSVYPLPVANFTIDSNFLTATSNTGFYQWYLNGELIPESNLQTIEIEEDGMYSVEVTNEYGCTSVSAEFFVSYTSVSLNGDLDRSIKLYPNPAKNLITIEFNEVDSYECVVFESSGKRIESFQTAHSDRLIFDVSKYVKGTYIIEFSSGGMYWEVVFLVE